MHGLNDGLNKGQTDFGISFRLIMCILRHLPVSSSVDHMHLAKPFFDAGLIFGLGMCSTEKSQPPTKFRPVFDLAREFGIGYLTAHAGEEGPADYVRQALEELGVQRIDHGVRSLEEDEVVDMLVKRETLLTVCPLSNVCLQVKPRLEDVPLRELLERGVRVSQADACWLPELITVLAPSSRSTRTTRRTLADTSSRTTCRCRGLLTLRRVTGEQSWRTALRGVGCRMSKRRSSSRDWTR